ncbi:hypothetical protein [Olene mendosa nucleopolyhedrovirus]|uniref:Ac11 n=1 Tax=Olene mendosa nucleopolyhedrovirus TaxID=2933796 RepID=A0AAX3ATS3_9ABAC|nr:hypothetical protein QKV28_gp026 [Olene mendosa nucleopolyhedrovirus]UOQ18809.1 hypothetical protein [Olene mendosa nucleopolyhedrovirus]
MSIQEKLTVANYLCNFDARHGECFEPYRIARERLDHLRGEARYADGMSRIEREVRAARRLVTDYGPTAVREALLCMDASASADALMQWYVGGTRSTELHADVAAVLQNLETISDEAHRDGRDYDPEKFIALHNKADALVKAGACKFIARVNAGSLPALADAFNPHKKDRVGWWYDKFCVVTYTAKRYKDVRLRKVIDRFTKFNAYKIMTAGRGYNCPEAVAELYGGFYGLDRERFLRHNARCSRDLFDYLAGAGDGLDRTIEEFGKRMREPYEAMRDVADALFRNCKSDKDRNALFDLLCAANADELDEKCLFYVVKLYKNFYK